MRIILDPKAGTCGGVRRAIQLAEKELDRHHNSEVYVLGDIIHNEREVKRLEQAGLGTVHLDEINNDSRIQEKNGEGVTVLIRAHGEPPVTYQKLRKLNVNISDGTCPVVMRSQELAKEHVQKGYQVVIVGKHKHPEVIGILGHTQNKAIVVQYDEDLKKIKPDLPTFVMAQTTIKAQNFRKIVSEIDKKCKKVRVANTICRFVLSRDKKLPLFAKQADVILVVGGHKSSNTKMLFESCRAINPKSYHVVDAAEINYDWFEGAESIGITGSASTPLWLLNEFESELKMHFNMD